MMRQIESVTARCIVNEIDSTRINELVEQMKKQLYITDQMHKNRTEEIRIQQETVFGELLNEKNSTILTLQTEVGDLKSKLNERIDEYRKGNHDELLTLKKETHQLKEILKVKQSIINQLRDELNRANDDIESLEMEKQRIISGDLLSDAIHEDEMFDHLKIISKALRSNQNLVNLIEIEAIA